ARVGEACSEISARRGVLIRTELVNADAPAQCDPRIVRTLMAACDAHRLACRAMVSRAYHDTLFMSRIAVAGMLFIPCRGGVSHQPDEYAAPEAIANGALVLAETLARLSAPAE